MLSRLKNVECIQWTEGTAFSAENSARRCSTVLGRSRQHASKSQRPKHLPSRTKQRMAGHACGHSVYRLTTESVSHCPGRRRSISARSRRNSLPPLRGILRLMVCGQRPAPTRGGGKRQWEKESETPRRGRTYGAVRSSPGSRCCARARWTALRSESSTALYTQRRGGGGGGKAPSSRRVCG